MATFAEPDGGYLSGYENAAPQVQGISFWSTAAYLFTLLLVFVFVLVLAYLAAKFLSGKFSPNLTGNAGRILEHMALGPNRSICVVEMIDRFFLIGVTDHSITLLSEITDEDEIEKLKASSLKNPVSEDFFSEELGSLLGMLKRIGNRR